MRSAFRSSAQYSAAEPIRNASFLGPALENLTNSASTIFWSINGKELRFVALVPQSTAGLLFHQLLMKVERCYVVCPR
jgi:hypothetical protein